MSLVSDNGALQSRCNPVYTSLEGLVLRCRVSPGAEAQGGTLIDRVNQAAKSANIRSRLELAKEVQVSTSTLGRFLSGKFFDRSHPAPSLGKPLTTRQLKGYVRTLARLARFAHVDIRTALSEYGIPTDRADVMTWVESAIEEGRKSPSHMPADPVFDALAGSVYPRIGILRWAPFAVERDIADSWAARLVGRLVRSIRPPAPDSELSAFRDMGFQLNALESIDEAIGAVLSHSDQGLHACFGIYDTPSRRLRGLDFLNLPGLGVPLGAVFTDARANWDTILDSKDARFRLLTLQGEIGYLFAHAIARKPTVIDAGPPEFIALQLALEAARNIDPKRHVVFLADYPTCKQVDEAFNSPALKKQCRGHLTDEPAIERLSNLSSCPLPTDAVSYRIGIAVPLTAQLWKSLLRDALHDELFRNTARLTARHYFDLLTNDTIWGVESENKQPQSLVPLPLSDELPVHSVQLFLNALQALLDDVNLSNTQRYRLGWWKKRWEELDKPFWVKSLIPEGRPSPGSKDEHQLNSIDQ